MNTTISVTVNIEYPNVPLILKRQSQMKKTLNKIKKCNDSSENYLVFCDDDEDSDLQLQIKFCSVCGNYMKWNKPLELDEQIVCCDMEHYKLEEAKIYKREMKKSMAKIGKWQEHYDSESLQAELLNMCSLAIDWSNNI